jgi:AbrB family looped-hinge helix DNA binding protein
MTGKIPTVRVTEKGQVTIPKDLREQFGIVAGTEVEFVRNRDHIVLRKVSGTPSRGQQLARRLRGRGDVKLTTDEIMALTRST